MLRAGTPDRRNAPGHVVIDGRRVGCRQPNPIGAVTYPHRVSCEVGGAQARDQVPHDVRGRCRIVDTAGERTQRDVAQATPLEIMLKSARFFDEQADAASKAGELEDEKRMRDKASEIAARAAPYMHPRLEAVEWQGSVQMSHEEALKELRQGVEDE